MRLIMKFFKTQKKDTLTRINLLAKVDQLTSFDMIYVYHLLSIGSKLNLTKYEQKLNGDYVYSVMFNTFKLGYITISNGSLKSFDNELSLVASVFGLGKEKYLPLKSLEVSVSQNVFKMVS